MNQFLVSGLVFCGLLIGGALLIEGCADPRPKPKAAPKAADPTRVVLYEHGSGFKMPPHQYEDTTLTACVTNYIERNRKCIFADEKGTTCYMFFDEPNVMAWSVHAMDCPTQPAGILNP